MSNKTPQDSQSLKKQLVLKMVAYNTEVRMAILGAAPAINERPTFKGLWDTVMVLLPKLHKIKYPDYLTEGIAGMMMKPAAFALVSTRL